VISGILEAAAVLGRETVQTGRGWLKCGGGETLEPMSPPTSENRTVVRLPKGRTARRCDGWRNFQMVSQRSGNLAKLMSSK
jgi:hypothetical protein